MFSENLLILSICSAPNWKLHKNKEFSHRNIVFYGVFLFFKLEAPRKCTLLNDSSHGFNTTICKLDPSYILELLFKDIFSKNFKSEAPQFLRKMIEQMREIACFAFFFMGALSSEASSMAL